MDRATALVVQGFLKLTDSQKNEALAEINRSQRGELAAVRESVRISITSVNFGPMPVGGCPCCGK